MIYEEQHEAFGIHHVEFRYDPDPGDYDDMSDSAEYRAEVEAWEDDLPIDWWEDDDWYTLSGLDETDLELLTETEESDEDTTPF